MSNNKIICVGGKNEIGVATLENILALKPENTELVICCNKTETGEDGWNRSLRKWANNYGIREVQLEELYSIEDLLFLSMEYDSLIRPNLFKSNKLINIHFSLLPKYKGMYTSAIPILNGETESGCTLHKIAAGIDTGDILDQIKFDILPSDTCRDLYFKYEKYGIELVKRNLKGLIFDFDNLEFIKQSPYGSTYYSRKYIDYTNIVIDLNTTAEMITRQLRAFTFKEYQLPRVYEHEIVSWEILDSVSNAKSGTVIDENSENLTIATVDYDLKLYK